MGIVGVIGGIWTLGMVVICALCYVAGEADDADARPDTASVRSHEPAAQQEALSLVEAAIETHQVSVR